MVRLWLLTLAGALALVGVGCNQLPGLGGAAPFDRQFVDMTVPHHQSAIEAARAAETRAQKPEIKQLANDIIAAQQQEIDQMQQWRKAWYGA